MFKLLLCICFCIYTFALLANKVRTAHFLSKNDHFAVDSFWERWSCTFGIRQFPKLKHFLPCLPLHRYSNLILNLFSLMVDANIPDIALEPDKTVKKVRTKFLVIRKKYALRDGQSQLARQIRYLN